MKVTDPNEIRKFQKFLDEYNDCFYQRDIESLKNLYVSDGDIIFFDNHEDCDSQDLEDHLLKVFKFFESGNIEEILSEDKVIYQHGNSACILMKCRYPSKPKPGVRTTMYLESHDNEWKIRHIHYSFDPNE